MLATIFCSYNCSLYLVFDKLLVISRTRHGIEEINVNWLYLCIVLRVTEDCFPGKGRIPKPDPWGLAQIEVDVSRLHHICLTIG